MISKLFIQNFAIIDEISIEFHAGLNIITGETGAGKSILIGALSLLLGARADIASLKLKDKKCIVEGIFTQDELPVLSQFLKNNELDVEPELVVRREISASGKSRGFINDTPVSLQQLRELAVLLVDLHQQFDTLQIGDTKFQRVVVDTLANNQEAVLEYQQIFKQWKNTQIQLRELQSKKADADKELDYLQFQLSELSEANFTADELENADIELQTLTHAEEIKRVLNELNFVLKDGEEPIGQTLKSLQNKLRNFSEINASIGDLAGRLESVQIELEDVAQEAESIADQTNLDEERIDFLNERISLGYKLQKKHNAASTNELIAIQKDLESRVQQFEQISGDEQALETTLKTLHKSLGEKAKVLTVNRKKIIPTTEKEIDTLLTQVGMPNAKIKIELDPLTDWNEYGQEQVNFLFDANKSGKFELVSKVASGGELSRLMLSIKSLVAKYVQLPTLIFDEIDTGISGEAAKQVGVIMKALGKNIQVISITHQPQIAAKADAHYFVFKKESEKGINTGIRLLSENDRIKAIAQMIGGENPSEFALANAKELMAD
ncbi:DNA repair protein RecN [Rhizosphaericola mali]|uniref:DNA repair protein RecN n=1 Tax=Rhizosphaericola mali TaxID=2545455 RepID=A0A5P2G9L4_9BACT|nr:DNA repair protein RecN [Rhizosphaericola mali]QES89903.1 DNA repair protein RecN [Rhizosphaericola mali]